ncbi:hypothetical protein [Micromonospora chersina]
MTDLGPVAWPPEPIRTGRLREPEARDRATFWDAEQWLGLRPPAMPPV